MDSQESAADSNGGLPFLYQPVALCLAILSRKRASAAAPTPLNFCLIFALN